MAEESEESSDFGADDIKAIGEGIGAAGRGIGAATGGISGGGGGTSQQAVSPATNTGSTESCTAQSVATEMAVGLRDDSGRVNSKGQAEGLPTCDSATRQAGVKLFRQQFGGGTNPPQPQPNTGGGQTAPPPSTELPASIEFRGVDNALLRQAVELGKRLVKNHGESVAQKFLAALAGARGRRINPNPINPMCAEKIVDALPDKWKEVVELWQCGAEEPYGQGQEGQDLWLALQIATGSLDMKSGTQSKCVRG